MVEGGNSSETTEGSIKVIIIIVKVVEGGNSSETTEGSIKVIIVKVVEEGKELINVTSSVTVLLL